MPAKKKTSIKKAPAKTAKKTVAAAKSSMSSASMSTKSDASCSTGNRGTLTTVLIIINTILLALLATGYTVKKAMQEMEAQRVGGWENYELIQQIYDLDTFKQQQKFQIEQTLQALQATAPDTTQQQVPAEQAPAQ